MVLQGKKVQLRPLKLSDYKWLYKLINDQRVNRFLLTSGVKTLAAEKAKVAKMIKDKKSYHFIIETNVSQEPIGIMTLGHIVKEHGRASTGAFIAKAFWNKGYGSDAKMTLLKFAYTKLGLNRIESYVYKNNPRSLQYSLKCGYKLEGCLRQRVKKGQEFKDEYVLSVLKKDWLKIAKKYDYL
ncbi:GNAT family N-acetyltransferase [Patescibacteria group bacterium]|nr:GNAT family N-acetyltransferase [Patescibacteria group bacterium]